jgi:hypothetical protein
MEQESKTVFHVTQNFNAPIGQYVQHIDHQVLHFDENMQMQVLEQSLKTPTQASERIASDLHSATLDSIFRANEVDKEGKRDLLRAILDQTKVKSKACRLLYKYKGCFNLDAHDDTAKARVMNAWTKELKLLGEHHFKQEFTNQDFYSYYCKE